LGNRDGTDTLRAEGGPCRSCGSWLPYSPAAIVMPCILVGVATWALSAMLIDFFFTLRAAKLKVSVKEYLTLLEAIRSGVIDDGDGPTVDKFYYLARTSLVKDEAQFDKFDRAFATYFKGVEMLADFSQDIPLEWLQKKLEL